MPGALARRYRYCALGALLALGAPLGLLLVQAARVARLSYPWLVGELAREAWVYGYVGVSTMAVFAAFGYTLGLQADRLQDLARADPLTGLLNRRAFEDRLEEEFARAARFGMSLSLLVLDLDGLKELNDREGHRQGDAALRALALALKRGSRISDIGARWGGDEFVVLAPGTGRTDAFELAERIRTSVASTDPPGLTVSIGLATVEPGDLQARPGTLVSEADTALYAAKRLGRNRVVAL